MTAPSRFEQFVCFSNDSVGLERLLRLIQSLIQIITSYPLLLTLISPFTNSHPTSSLALSATLSLLRGRVALARRFLRVFRFLDNFQIAHRLFFPPSPTGTLSTATYLTALSRTFNGLYLFLESSTLPDALGIQGLFSPVTAAAGALGWGIDEKGEAGFDPVWRANIEAQRFWFLSLGCAVAAGVIKLYRMRGAAEREKKALTETEKATAKASEKSVAVVKPKADTNREHFVTVRKLVADFLDLALPGSIVGWVPLEAGPVSIVMLVSTILTGWEVWERVGKEMVRGSS